jgi:hypothetical protein
MSVSVNAAAINISHSVAQVPYFPISVASQLPYICCSYKPIFGMCMKATNILSLSTLAPPTSFRLLHYNKVVLLEQQMQKLDDANSSS